ncbi:MAG: hypothetical protein GX245_05960 [Eubacteriaceae bacterium]|jgi:penicillin-binding protein 1A|nr:hypothetical protein [Eubacteriaceae bacterium]
MDKKIKKPQKNPAKKNSASFLDKFKKNIKKQQHKNAAYPASPKPPKMTAEQKKLYHAKIKEEFAPIPKSKYKRLSKEQQKIYRYQERVAIPKKKVIYIIQLIAVAGFALILLGGTILSFFGFYWIATAPDIDLENLKYIESSIIVDKDGHFYQELQGKEKRKAVGIDQIPEQVQFAFIAIEDERFYTHQGIDLKGITRAVLNIVKKRSLSGPGGSTITQQLIKGTHLSDVKRIQRKVMEWKLSIELENMLTKDQILAAYLNKINFAWAWGIESASNTFFDKPCSELTLAQSAVLAAMPQAPSIYLPFVLETNTEDNVSYIVSATDEAGNKYYPLNPKNAERAKLVLNKMLELKYIVKAEYDIAIQQIDSGNVGLKPESTSSTVYSYFTDALYEQLLKDMVNKYGYTQESAQDTLLNGGLVIHSTLDPQIQSILEKNASNSRLFPSQSSTARAASAAKSAATGETVNYIPQCAMVVIDNQTGYVAGLIGGREKTASLSLNRATRKFQVGSSTKPLTVYGPGLDTGVLTLATTFDDVRINAGGWKPTNSGGGQSGMTTVRNGLAKSLNLVAAQAWYLVGVETSSSYALKLGLELEESDYGAAALSLGGYTRGQTPLVMAAAFTTFPNQGIRTDPLLYTAVYDREGNLLFENKAEKTQVFSPATSYLITDVLQMVVRGGTTSISISGIPVAGKTGTTDERRHAYFCGYTPYYTGAVWYGYDENKVIANGQTYTLNIGIFGGSKPGPAYMWEVNMREIHSAKGLSSGSFPARPDNIVTAAVDNVSGKLPTELSSRDPRGSRVYTEMFIAGTVPSEPDDFHQELVLCNVSGKTATQYCPPDLVTKKVVIVKPDSRFPAGVKALNPTFVPANEQDVVYFPAEGEAENCPIHNASSVAAIDLYYGGSAPNDVTVNQNDTVTFTVQGTNAIGGQVSGLTNLSAGTSNNNVASVSISGNNVTVKGKKGGNAVITVTYTDPHGSAFSTSVNVTVKATYVIVLKTNSITLSLGAPLPNFTTYIKSVKDGAGNDIPFSNVNISHNVDTSQANTYDVKYSLGDAMEILKVTVE